MAESQVPRLELPFFRPNRIGLLHSARDGVANGLGTRYLNVLMDLDAISVR